MKNEILEKMQNQKNALTLIEINDLLGMQTTEEYSALKQEIDSLVSEGKIHHTKKDKYILMEYCSSLLTGILHINKKGNGFVDTKYDEDTFISYKNLNGAVDGDFVEIDVNNNEGIVVNILKRDLTTVVGKMVLKHHKLAFELNDKKKDIHFEITRDSLKKVVEGQIVLVKVKKELKQNLYLGEIVKVLGHENDPGVDILTIAAAHEIYLDFNDEVKSQVANMETSVTEEEIKDRVDLRNEIIFTIDGDDTKDIDDAISISYEDGIYKLGVHIADVSHYVTEGSPLFESALEKGTSSYLADKVLPMLPHELSNGICSLNEGEDRLTISCVMDINENGKVVSYDIFPSVIRSSKKMTYKNVNKVIMENIIPEGYENYAEKLNYMHDLAGILRKAKVRRGYIDFGLDEAKVVQDKEGNAIDIIKRERGEGEKLIEDFMICANETVASHIYNMSLPFVYRVHDKPRSEKIDDFLNLLKVMGYKMDISTNNITPYSMQEILKYLSDKQEFEILSDMLLRSMKKAIYSPNNIGHFGIASKMYTHFTSPIRRFPDLMVHTLLHKYLFENKMDMQTIKYYESILASYCEKASEREVAAIEAEREVLDMKMAEYMTGHIGESYDGIISGVTNFGMFVKLDNLVEGLVHISSLKGFYTYNSELLSLVSQNQIKYTIGDKVHVKVVGASKENRTIDFEIEDKDETNQ